MATIQQTLGGYLKKAPDSFIEAWISEATRVAGTKASSASAMTDVRTMTNLLHDGLIAGGEPDAITSSAWAPLLRNLGDLSASRAAKGDTAGDTSVFVLAMKKPLFGALQAELRSDADTLARALWWVTTLIDQFAQHTATTYQRTREDIIGRQQQELLELSTPVIKLWEGILAVPMIGTLDSNRTQLVMETLLQELVDTEARLAIIDITGVPTVDTLVAQHLLKTVTAIRLMGAECIISGIRPQIAQTIVHLGIDLEGIITKATLADALRVGMRMTGTSLSREKA